MAPWTYSTGERGRNRVRVSEDTRRGGKLFVEFRDESGKHRQYLSHTDRDRAKQQTEEMAAAFRSAPSRKTPQTLFEILNVYLAEVTPRKGGGAQQHNRTAAQLFVRAWGKDRKPLTIGLREWQRFIADRRSGRLAPKGPKGRHSANGVRDRQVSQDLKFILAVFRWATMAGDGEGGVLLDRNPCAGFPIPVELSPKRPRMSASRYQAMLAVARSVDAQFELALILAHETGHRCSSIRQLWWSDVQWNEQTVRWRAETDKQDTAHVTPLTPAALVALTDARSRALALGDVWIFADAQASGPRSRNTFAKWWLEAERLAGLEHDQRWGYHSLRRQFASELKDEPLSDVAALGGWKSTATLLTCYIEADPGTMKRALARRRALSEERMESTNGEQDHASN